MDKDLVEFFIQFSEDEIGKELLKLIAENKDNQEIFHQIMDKKEIKDD